jgi:hypothetical protein
VPRLGFRYVCQTCPTSNPNMFGSLTSQRLDSLRGTIKGVSHPLHSFRHFIDLKTLWIKASWVKHYPPQASLKSKPPRRDLSHLLECPSQSSNQHFTDDLRAFVSLGDLSPRWTRCPLGATKVVMSLRKFVWPSPSWGFDSRKQNSILVIVRQGETRPFVGTSTEM